MYLNSTSERFSLHCLLCVHEVATFISMYLKGNDTNGVHIM